MTGTHDLPTIAGWWRGRDIDWTSATSALFTPPTRQRARPRRVRGWWDSFVEAGVAEGAQPAPDEPAPVVDARARLRRPDAVRAGDRAARGSRRPGRAAQPARHHRRTPQLAPPHARHDTPALLADPTSRARTWPLLDESPHPMTLRAPPTACSSTRTSPSPMPRRSCRISTSSASATSTPRRSPPRRRARRTATTWSIRPRINPELGGEDGFRALVAALRARGHGRRSSTSCPTTWASPGGENAWWNDVLAHGRGSEFAALLRHRLGRSRSCCPCSAIRLPQRIGRWRHRGRAATRSSRYGEHRFPLRARGPWHHATGRQRRAARTPALPPGLVARRRTTSSTGGASSRSTSWPASASRIRRCSRRRMRCYFRLYGEGLIDGVRVDHVDGLTDPAGYCRSCVRDSTRCGARTADHRGSRRSSPATSRWRPTGASTAPAATTSWRRSPRCSTIPPARRRWARRGRRESGRPADFAAEELQARQDDARLAVRGAARRLRRVRSRRWPTATPRQWPDARDAAPRDRAAAVGLPGLSHLWHRRRRARRRRRDPRPGARAGRAADPAGRGRWSSTRCSPGWRARVRATRSWRRKRCGGSSSCPRRSRPRRSRIPPSTAMAACSRATTSASMPSASRCRSTTSTRAMTARAADWPHAMLATATHDHKRGEDVRARLAVLSDDARAVADARRAAGTRWPRRRCDGVDPADRVHAATRRWSAHGRRGWRSTMPTGWRPSPSGSTPGRKRRCARRKLRSSWEAPQRGVRGDLQGRGRDAARPGAIGVLPGRRRRASWPRWHRRRPRTRLAQLALRLHRARRAGYCIRGPSCST